jgi:hypothetical protein
LEAKTRKKYEANKTIAQIWLKNGIIIGIVVIVGGLIYGFGRNVYLLFASADHEGALIWSSEDGVGYSDKGGDRTRIYKLPNRANEPLKSPRFWVRDNSFAYYSPVDKSVCILQEGGQEKWVDLSQAIGDSTVFDIRPSKKGLMFVGFSASSFEDNIPAASNLAELDMSNLVVTPGEAQDVRIDPGTGKAITRAANGRVNSSGGTAFAGVPEQAVAWDYDFSNETLVLDEGKAVHAIAKGKDTAFGLGMIYYLRAAEAAQPGEVWCEAVKPFHAGYMLVSFGSDGAFKKLLLKDERRIGPPYIKPSPTILNILDIVSKKVGD